MGRKLHIYAGRTRLRIRNGQLVKFFRRSKSFKYGIKRHSKARRYERNNSGCTESN